MSKEETIIRFENVSFRFSEEKVILDKVNFNIRKNSKITIMGQNGAGKSTLFKILTGELKPNEGNVFISKDLKISIASQVMPKEYLEYTIEEYFKKAFEKVPFDLPKHIKNVFEIVNLDLDITKKIENLSGGQKARLLLAFALISEPDILLLDEPTNNLDKEGIEHLTNFLTYYWNTVVVISHDADFLNSFTDGVLNLDVRSHKIEQFVGNYFDVLQKIEEHIENQRLQNARIEKSIRDRYEKVNKLGAKSVAMRRLANKVRSQIEEDKLDIVEVRRDDKVLPNFEIPYQHFPSRLIQIDQVSFLRGAEVQSRKVDIELRRGQRLLISGPNGIGKSTLLKSVLDQKGAQIDPEVRVGYYSQDFSELDFQQTGMESLLSVNLESTTDEVFSMAGRFLLNGKLLENKIETYSEGQKGLLCYARFMIQQPGLLIMDEPTNHINFRHLPAISNAISTFKGALILISHIPSFVGSLQIDRELDLTKI